jgi:hypothetical protein
MAADVGIWGTIIPAITGLGGVVLGSYLAGARERQREQNNLQKDAVYLSILVVSHLDSFIGNCVAVVYDDGTSYGQPAGENGYHETTTSTPIFDPISLDVNWKSLPADLMYQILSLSQIGEYDDPPDYPNTFCERQHGYASLGIKASKIAAQLREHSGIPSAEHIEGEWNRDDFLKERVTELQHRRQVSDDAKKRSSLFQTMQS